MTQQAPRRPPRPVSRRLQVYAFDPSLAARLETSTINRLVLEVPWEARPESGESSLEPGPVGEYLEVVDVDPANELCYAPVDLDHPHLLAQDGLRPSEGNPQFHQQMAYAVATSTIRSFEHALGRCALWRGRPSDDPDYPFGEFEQRLRIYPHALREANAYYSPGKIAVLFGYFPVSRQHPGANLPGGMVFTCLSHEIIAHETTHALLDGMQQRFLEPTNPDVHALHEAIADIVALFQHFSHPQVLCHQIGQTRGDLGKQHLLAKLAHQFGDAIGRRGALRDALGTIDEDGEWNRKKPDPEEILTTHEPHARGGILVAAVFDAFLKIYSSRIRDLLRIASGGTGILPEGELHPDLVRRLATEAAKSARHILAICIRALDYVPPVDVTFGEYLRAMITADRDMVPSDERSYRIAIIEAFRCRGIFPARVRSLSPDSVCWDDPLTTGTLDTFHKLVDKLKVKGGADERGDIFMQIQPDWGLSTDRKGVFEQVNRVAVRLQKWLDSREDLFNAADLDDIGEVLGLALGRSAPATVRRDDSGLPAVKVHAIRPARRFGPDGDSLVDLVVQLTQSRDAYMTDAEQVMADAGKPQKGSGPAFDFTAGCTLLIDLAQGRVRYCIRKRILGDERLERYRENRRLGHHLSAYGPGLLKREPFAGLHRSMGGL